MLFIYLYIYIVRTCLLKTNVCVEHEHLCRTRTSSSNTNIGASTWGSLLASILTLRSLCSCSIVHVRVRQVCPYSTVRQYDSTTVRVYIIYKNIKTAKITKIQNDNNGKIDIIKYVWISHSFYFLNPQNFNVLFRYIYIYIYMCTSFPYFIFYSFCIFLDCGISYIFIYTIYTRTVVLSYCHIYIVPTCLSKTNVCVEHEQLFRTRT